MIKKKKKKSRDVTPTRVNTLFLSTLENVVYL